MKPKRLSVLCEILRLMLSSDRSGWPISAACRGRRAVPNSGAMNCAPTPPSRGFGGFGLSVLDFAKSSSEIAKSRSLRTPATTVFALLLRWMNVQLAGTDQAAIIAHEGNAKDVKKGDGYRNHPPFTHTEQNQASVQQFPPDPYEADKTGSEEPCGAGYGDRAAVITRKHVINRTVGNIIFLE